MKRVPFADATDVGSIRYRLAAMDVGWSLRGERVTVEIVEADDAPIRVSCDDARGDRWVLEGRACEVRTALARMGYVVAGDGGAR